MTNNKRKQMVAAAWCVAAFLLGCVLFSGCAATAKTRASVFDMDAGAGAGIYLEGEIPHVDKH